LRARFDFLKTIKSPGNNGPPAYREPFLNTNAAFGNLDRIEEGHMDGLVTSLLWGRAPRGTAEMPWRVGRRPPLMSWANILSEKTNFCFAMST
jgi:hypothetical protein